MNSKTEHTSEGYFGIACRSRFLILLYVGLGLMLLSPQKVWAQEVSIRGEVILEEGKAPPEEKSTGGYQTTTGGGGNAVQESSNETVILWLEDRETETDYTDRQDEVQVLDQVDKAFKPKLMAVRAGHEVRIMNSDPMYHNVFSLSRIKRFDVGRRSPGDYEDIRFDKPGVVDVFCDIHSDMHAEIVVLPRQTVQWKKREGSGSFQFENIPHGKYTLHLYALGDREKSVSVNASDSSMVELAPVRLGP